jgi:hypothetical protein
MDDRTFLLMVAAPFTIWGVVTLHIKWAEHVERLGQKGKFSAAEIHLKLLITATLATSTFTILSLLNYFLKAVNYGS